MVDEDDNGDGDGAVVCFFSAASACKRRSSAKRLRACAGSIG